MIKTSLERKITIWFAVALCITLYFIYLTFQSRTGHLERIRWVNHSYKITTRIQEINDYIQSSELITHQYLISGKEICMLNYNTTLNKLNGSIKELKELTRNDPEQKEYTSDLNSLYKKVVNEQLNSIRLRKSDGFEGALKAFASEGNETINDSLRKVIRLIDAKEDSLLDERIVAQEKAAQNTNIRLIGLISFFMLLIGILYFRIISDIKKKQEAQRKLEESERLLWTIFNETSDALFITNTMTNRIERCNRRAIELFEVENQEELFGKVGPDFHKAPLGPDEMDGINSTIMENKVWTGEIEYVTKKGRTFWGAVSITSFRLQDEVYKHVRIVDISVRKDAEKARKRYADELERSKQQLEKTTTELLSANEQLRLSENELKRLNASKDKFFSILAHDLRSPFAGFLGISEYLAYSLNLIDKNELNELLLVVHQTAKRIYGLLNNLLEWSRIQMGKVEFKPVEVPLYEIAQQVTELIKPNADQKDIKIFYEVGRDTRVFADINMVMTILRNLLSNAVKFTNPGGEVKLYAREAGAMIEISVRDSGIGINFEDMKKIFKIDSGYSSRGTEGEEGSGLGLILCRELVEKNRGTIQVNSIQGSGTEFMFTLQNAEYLKTEGNIIS